MPRNQVSDWCALPGGAAANIACGLAKLGESVSFVGAVGKDGWGDALVTLLSDMGVEHTGVQRRLKVPTREVYITCDRAGERTSSSFSDRDPALFADAHLFADSLDRALFSKAELLVLGLCGMAYSDTKQAVEQAIQFVQEIQTPIFVDIDWQPMFWPQPSEATGCAYDLIGKAQFLKVSKVEAQWLFSTVSAVAIAHQFPHLQGVFITDERQGCEYCLMGNEGYVSGFDVDIEETTGARDAFTAGFIHRLLRLSAKDKDALADEAIARQAVTYACAVAALTTTRMGAIAALPTVTEIDAFLYLNAAR